MGIYRDDLSERGIRFDLVNGKSVVSTAMKYGCSEALVRNIRDGKRPPPPVQTTKVVPAEDLCECCNYRPKAKGHRYLCGYCYQHADSGTIY